MENLTVLNALANGLYWSGVRGFRACYVTAYNNKDYGIYAFDSSDGMFEHSYASGSPDSGFYIGQCDPCQAVIDEVLAERNGLGYSGTNAGGELTSSIPSGGTTRPGSSPTPSTPSCCRPSTVDIVGNDIQDNDNREAPGEKCGWSGAPSATASSSAAATPRGSCATGWSTTSTTASSSRPTSTPLLDRLVQPGGGQRGRGLGTGRPGPGRPGRRRQLLPGQPGPDHDPGGAPGVLALLGPAAAAAHGPVHHPGQPRPGRRGQHRRLPGQPVRGPAGAPAPGPAPRRGRGAGAAGRRRLPAAPGRPGHGPAARPLRPATDRPQGANRVRRPHPGRIPLAARLRPLRLPAAVRAVRRLDLAGPVGPGPPRRPAPGRRHRLDRGRAAGPVPGRDRLPRARPAQLPAWLRAAVVGGGLVAYLVVLGIGALLGGIA